MRSENTRFYSLRRAAVVLGIRTDDVAAAVRRGTIRATRRRGALVVSVEELARHLAPPSPDAPLTGAPDRSAILDALDRYRAVPTDVLAEITDRDCVGPTDGTEPPDAATDAELAAQVCGACRSPLACVELELRHHGAETVGVWGGLPDDEIRALYRGWLDRRGPHVGRALDDTDSDIDPDEGAEGWRR